VVIGLWLGFLLGRDRSVILFRSIIKFGRFRGGKRRGRGNARGY
jgi:hypothetical protein